MAAVALAVIAGDLVLLPYVTPWERTVPALGAIALYAVLLDGDRAALGWTVAPRPSLRYWITATLVIAALVAILVGIGVLYVLATGQGIQMRDTHLPWWFRIRYFVIEGPALEEIIYRAAIVTGLCAALRPWGAIVVSTVAFGYLHVLYGNPAPNNLLGGLFFAWAYLRSGTLLVPLALHSLGNLAVVVLNHVGALILGG